jgi:hypothetical protein
MTAGDAAARKRLLTFRSGGWVLLLAGLFSAGIFTWAIAGPFLRPGPPLAGDGRDPATYGFDLAGFRGDRALLIASGLRKDALRALVQPRVMTGAAAEQLRGRSRYLVSADRVIGVTINGESRAYPLMVMQCHEIANDVLGGVPIAVTYHPPCDSVVVFERASAGEVLEFGVSGLLYNSNLLMFDRRGAAGGESLWCQLLGRAVSGPAAGRGLSIVDADLAAWADWLAAHPDTTVLDRDPRMVRRYKETNYENYFTSSVLMFPFDPPPPEGGPDAKARVVALAAGDARAVYPVATAAALAGPGGTWTTPLGPAALSFRNGYRGTLDVSSDPPGAVRTIYAFWFAWHALHPDDVPFRP